MAFCDILTSCIFLIFELTATRNPQAVLDYNHIQIRQLKAIYNYCRQSKIDRVM